MGFCKSLKEPLPNPLLKGEGTSTKIFAFMKLDATPSPSGRGLG